MIVGLSFAIDHQRKRTLWDKLLKGTIRHELEYEYALHILIKKVNTAMFLDPMSQKGSMAIADLLYLLDLH